MNRLQRRCRYSGWCDGGRCESASLHAVRGPPRCFHDRLCTFLNNRRSGTIRQDGITPRRTLHDPVDPSRLCMHASCYHSFPASPEHNPGSPIQPRAGRSLILRLHVPLALPLGPITMPMLLHSKPRPWPYQVCRSGIDCLPDPYVDGI